MALMRHLLACILLGAIVTTCAARCLRKGVECIQYEVIEEFEGYELRQFPPTVWVSTSYESYTWMEARDYMLAKLTKYINGKNEKGLKISATTPVRTRVSGWRGPTQPSSFVMSFVLPANLTSPPKPLDPALFISIEAPQRYYVRTFGGFPSEVEWVKQSHALAGHVNAEKKITRSYYYIVFYDNLRDLFYRTNEVWMLKHSS